MEDNMMPKRIYTEEEARLRKNERQREYAKKTGYAANRKSDKKNMTSMLLKFSYNTEQDILDWLATKDNKSGYIKALIRKDIAESE